MTRKRGREDSESKTIAVKRARKSQHNISQEQEITDSLETQFPDIFDLSQSQESENLEDKIKIESQDSSKTDIPEIQESNNSLIDKPADQEEVKDSQGDFVIDVSNDEEELSFLSQSPPSPPSPISMAGLENKEDIVKQIENCVQNIISNTDKAFKEVYLESLSKLLIHSDLSDTVNINKECIRLSTYLKELCQREVISEDIKSILSKRLQDEDKSQSSIDIGDISAASPSSPKTQIDPQEYESLLEDEFRNYDYQK